MWEGVLRREADPFTGFAREDASTIKVQRIVFGPHSSQLRRMGHLNICSSLHRPTVNYGNTINNALKGLKARVYVEGPGWDPPPEYRSVLRRAAIMQSRRLSPEPLDEGGMEEVLKRFPPGKRELYSRALDEQLVLPEHARVKAFIKCENVPYAPVKDKPRLIQFRDPKFLAHMLSWYKPMEHCMLEDNYSWNRYQRRTCAKGLNNLQRMHALLTLVGELPDCHVVDLDGSAFDAHQSPEALAVEWKHYQDLARLRGWPKDVRSLIHSMGRCQQYNRCYLRADDGVVKYKVRGNRMSGDLNTGNGNNFLQSSYITAAMKTLRVPEKHWRMLVDGDDAVLLVSGAYKDRLSGLAEVFRRFNQDMKIGDVLPVDESSMERIDFCQSRPVLVNGVWRLIRNPKKVYNGYSMVNLYYRSLEETSRFMATVARPEMIFARGVPVLSSLFECFHRLSGDAEPLQGVARRFWLRQCEHYHTIIPDEDVAWSTRESFAKAFSITPTEQLCMEHELSAWDRGHLVETMSASGWVEAGDNGVTGGW